MAIHAVFAFVASAREPVQMDIMTGISALSQALNIAKQLKEFEREFKDAEFKLKIADLYSSLADAKIALADAKIELDAKEAEIERLKRTHRRLEEETVEIRGYRYPKSEGEPMQHPFCPVCQQKEGLLIQTTTDIARTSSTAFRTR